MFLWQANTYSFYLDYLYLQFFNLTTQHIVVVFCFVPSEQPVCASEWGPGWCCLLVTIAHRGLLIVPVITLNSTKKAPCCGTFRSRVLSESVVLDSQLTLTNTAELFCQCRVQSHPRQEEQCRNIFPASYGYHKDQLLHSSIYLRNIIAVIKFPFLVKAGQNKHREFTHLLLYYI